MSFNQLYEEMYRAMIAKDTVRLSSLLTDDFVLVHMTGMHQAKSDYLAAIARGTLNYYSCEDTRLTITVQDENSVQMIGKSEVNAAVFGGGRNTWPLQLNLSLRKEGTEWRFCHAEASTY